MEKHRLKILLVDDDEDDFIETRSLLAESEQGRFDLDWAQTYEAGVEGLERCEHDAYLVDYRLGGRTGLEMLARAQALGCKAPLILLTGQGDRDIDVAAMHAGAADYLVKGRIDAPLLERSIRYAIERRRSEEALRHSEERFRGAFEYSTIGVALVAADGRFLRVNGALCEMLGYEGAELLALDFQRVNHPDDLARALENHGRLLRREINHFQSEKRYLRKDGQTVWVLLSVSVALDAGGQPAFFIAHFNNITEKRNAEQALRESENRLRTIIQAEPECVKLVGVGGKLLDMNPAGLAMLEAASLEEVRSRSMLSYVVEHDRAAFGQVLTDVFEGKSRILDFEIVTFKGHRRWLQIHAVPLRNNEEQIIAMLGVSRDVTERKTTEARLAAERNLLRTVIDNIPDFIVVKDLESRYIIANAAQLRAVGARHSSEIVGKGDADFFSRERAEEYRIDDAGVLRTGQALVNRIERSGDSGKWLLTTKVPLRDSQGAVTGLVSISRDITEQLNLEAQLRHSQKMESVGQLAAGVAHDFNNILNIILGYSSLLLAVEGRPEAEELPLRQISAAAERAANLTRQLLTFSRKQVMQPKPVDLNQVVSNMTSMLHRVLGEHIALQFNYSPNVPLIYADVGMMEQVVLNLAVNSRDAMPKGGQLVISINPRTIELEYTQTNAEARPGRFVSLSVTDTGTGISAESLPRIFDPFFTTKEVGKGTGLGLATVYGVVKQHQGWIEVESQVGQGATFHIILPVSSQNVLPVSDPAQQIPVRGGTETILIVEDEPALRELASSILERHGYRVIEAHSGREALEIWKNHSKIDLLLTDMVMPEGVSGGELAQRLLELDPKLKVVYTSGYSVEIMEKEFSFRPGFNFLPKPYPPSKLAKIVRDCLDGLIGT